MDPIDGMTYLRQLMARGAPSVQPDATARPTAKESGVKDALLAALRKLSEWDTKQGRDIAARLPAGTTLQQGAVPDWISGPKGVASGLKRAAPFDAAHALEMGKIRAAETAAGEAPDLLPAMQRMGGGDDALAALKSRMQAGEMPRESSNPVDAWLKVRDVSAKSLMPDVTFGNGPTIHDALITVPQKRVSQAATELRQHLDLLRENPELLGDAVGTRATENAYRLLHDLEWRLGFGDFKVPKP